jgi:alpha-galactosidase
MLKARPVANGRLDVDSPVTLMAELGHGLFGSPGLRGIVRGWTVRRYSRPRGAAGQTLTITAKMHAGLRLTSELALDASGVLVVRHGLTNLKAQPWQVDRFAVTLPVAERARR